MRLTGEGAAAGTRTVRGSCAACLTTQIATSVGSRCCTVLYCTLFVTDLLLGVDACPAPVLTPVWVCVPRHCCRQAAVAAAEAAAAAAAEEQLAAAVSAQEARVLEMQSEVQRLRSSAQTYLRDEREVRRDGVLCDCGGTNGILRRRASGTVAQNRRRQRAAITRLAFIASLVFWQASHAYAGSTGGGFACVV